MACTHPLDPLYQTAHGAIYRCRGCRWLNVCFGPILLAYDQIGFREFARLVQMLRPVRDPSGGSTRCYHLRTPDRTIGFAFTAREVEELRALLDGALAMLTLEAILEETLGPSACGGCSPDP